MPCLKGFVRIFNLCLNDPTHTIYCAQNNSCYINHSGDECHTVSGHLYRPMEAMTKDLQHVRHLSLLPDLSA